jgi:glycosyltransferase involved in cell wall biosynthesis
MKLNVIYVMADSVVKPCGGLGERLSKLIPFLEKEMNLHIYCPGEGGRFSNTDCTSLHMEIPQYGNPYPMFYTNFILDNPPPFKPDIVVCTDYGTVLPAKMLAKFYNAKLVTEFHLAYYSLRKILKEEELVGGMMLDQAAKMVELFEKIGVESSDLVVGCSKAYVKDLPWGTKKAVAIQNGIDIEKYEVSHEPYKFAGGKKRNIVFIGRMNTQKGLKYLLDYYGIIHDYTRTLVAIPDSERLILPEDTALHFVGGPIGGDQFDALTLTTKHSDSKFHIPFVSGQEKISILKSADAILFPSVHEPFGIVGLEAFAAGVPLITTRVDGIADYADDTNSIKCELSAKSIRESIDKLFAMSDEERKKMIENGRVTTKKFNWGDIADFMISEFKILLET